MEGLCCVGRRRRRRMLRIKTFDFVGNCTCVWALVFECSSQSSPNIEQDIPPSVGPCAGRIDVTLGTWGSSIETSFLKPASDFLRLQFNWSEPAPKPPTIMSLVPLIAGTILCPNTGTGDAPAINVSLNRTFKPLFDSEGQSIRPPSASVHGTSKTKQSLCNPAALLYPP